MAQLLRHEKPLGGDCQACVLMGITGPMVSLNGAIIRS